MLKRRKQFAKGLKNTQIKKLKYYIIIYNARIEPNYRIIK